MNTSILWLSKHRLLTTILVLAYFVPNVLSHDLVSRISASTEKKLSLAVYNPVVGVTGLVALGILSWFIFVRIKNGSHKPLKAAYWSFTALLVVLSSNTFNARNIETIHFPQYALLTVPVFALTMRFGETVAWVTLLGAVDEAYQYLVLHRWSGIYDFGDVMLDLIGAGIGVVVIFTLIDANLIRNPGSTYSLRKLTKSPAFMILGGLIGCALLLYLTGLMQLYPAENASRAVIILNRAAPQAGFWLRPGPPYKTFHIPRPGEAAFLISVLTAVYVFMDYKIELKGKS